LNHVKKYQFFFHVTLIDKITSNGLATDIIMEEALPVFYWSSYEAKKLSMLY